MITKNPLTNVKLKQRKKVLVEKQECISDTHRVLGLTLPIHGIKHALLLPSLPANSFVALAGSSHVTFERTLPVAPVAITRP